MWRHATGQPGGARAGGRLPERVRDPASGLPAGRIAIFDDVQSRIGRSNLLALDLGERNDA